MNRCEHCSGVSSCPVCAGRVEGYEHVGVRSARPGGRPSGVWHYAVPCGHFLQAAGAVQLKYNGGPLWKDGYTWQNVYWGSYFASSPGWVAKLEKATSDIESDASYSGGLRQYNVGMGKVMKGVVIHMDPPTSLTNAQVKQALSSWVSSGTVAALGVEGAYNIFLPPGVTVHLSGDASCSYFCDYHDAAAGGQGPFYTVEPSPCQAGCNQCTTDPFDTLTQGLAEEMVELKTDMEPGTGWVIGSEELCDYCLPPDEILQGDNKAIMEYGVGDRVVGSAGLERVERTYERRFSGELVEIRAEGMLPFRVTPNHPILVARESRLPVRGRPARGVRHPLDASFDAPAWKKAEDLLEGHGVPSRGDCLVVPKLKGTVEMDTLPLEPCMERRGYRGGKTSLPLTGDTAWLLGTYVAAGSTDDARQFGFALAEDDTGVQERLASIPSRVGSQAPGGKRTVVCADPRPLLGLFREICGGPQRCIPDVILHNKDEGLLRAFLDGYVAGHVTPDGHLVVVTTSRLLIQQLQLAYARLGLFLKVGKTRTGRREGVPGRTAGRHDRYTGRLDLEPGREGRTRLHGDFLYVPIRKLARIPYEGKVYNIATKDHTYLVANAVVHNCDKHFVCNRIASGEYVNAWYDGKLGGCWKGEPGGGRPGGAPGP